jgi:AefR-like transcriptional repressor, C-terminal domain
LPLPQDRKTLARILASFGTQLIREITDPTVIAVFRLAIAEAVHAPEVAQALDSIGRETSRAALRQIMAGAQRASLLEGQPDELAEQFGGLLWGHLMVNLLLGVVARPNSRELETRAHDATAVFLQIHPRASCDP